MDGRIEVGVGQNSTARLGLKGLRKFCEKF